LVEYLFVHIHRSLTSITVSGRNGPPVTLDTTMTSADFSGKKLDAAAVAILVVLLKKSK
jgi:hypothetical protein